MFNQRLLIVSSLISWSLDLFHSWVGHANLDGQFNSSDLVIVLASGTYDSNVASIWTTGDFNGDGITNSTDLIAALAEGGYEVGPRPAMAAVPEPSAAILWVLAVIGSVLPRSRTRAVRPWRGGWLSQAGKLC